MLPSVQPALLWLSLLCTCVQPQQVSVAKQMEQYIEQQTNKHQATVNKHLEQTVADQLEKESNHQGYGAPYEEPNQALFEDDKRSQYSQYIASGPIIYRMSTSFGEPNNAQHTAQVK